MLKEIRPSVVEKGVIGVCAVRGNFYGISVKDQHEFNWKKVESNFHRNVFLIVGHA